MLKKELNLGDKDIKLRKNIGIASVVISLIPGSVVMLVVGVLLIGSASLRWRPIYSGLQKNTCAS
jgi:hypothetical protein